MAAAGWYPDPERPGNVRWWDGALWADSTYPAGASAPSAPTTQVEPVAPTPAQTGFHPPQIVPATAVFQPESPTYAPTYAPAGEVAGSSTTFASYSAVAPARRSVLGLALTSVILGAVAILAGWYVPLIGLIAAPAGLALGIIALTRRGAAAPDAFGAPGPAAGPVAGRALAVTGTVICGVALLVALIALTAWAILNS